MYLILASTTMQLWQSHMKKHFMIKIKLHA